MAPMKVRVQLCQLSAFGNLIVFELNVETGRQHYKTGTVKGTFEDLSDEEKTKAFLQLLEYRLKVEKVRDQSTNQPLKNA
jgi:hypothetical protein